MADEKLGAEVVDAAGHKVVLPARVWSEWIVHDHPELTDHLADVIATTAKPDHIEADPVPDRTRFHRRDIGPSRWLLAVVSFEQAPARIITALASRKDPKLWKP
jgi:hypothetical protein